MNHLTLAILAIVLLCSGTAMAGLGEKLSTAQSLPALGAPGQEAGTDAAAYTLEAPPESQKEALLPYDTGAGATISVYYSGAEKDWASFSAIFPGTSPAFWVATTRGWSWYATCPLGGWVKELMYIHKTGTVKLYEIYPMGITRMYSLGWGYKGYDYVWFNGDTPGRHITIFTVNDEPSNAVFIDVTSSPPPPPKKKGIKVGEEFTKSLPANPSTGYHWEAEYDKRVIDLVNRRFEPG
jgi:hypothetical protein